MDESILHGIFWNHLVYPELASDEMEDPAALLSWVQERLAGVEWPEYVVCVAVDGLDAGESDLRRETVRRIRAAIVESLLPSQCALIGFAHTNALYFCGCLNEERGEFVQRLTALNERIATVLSLPNSVGIAFLPDASVSSLQWAAAHAIVAQRQRMRTGSNGVFVFDEANFPIAFDQRAYGMLVQRAHTTVKSGDAEAAEALIGDINHALFQQTNLALQHLRPVLQCLVVFMAQAAMDVLVDPVALTERSQSYLWQIGAAYDYGRLREVLRDATSTFTHMVHERHRSLRHRLVAAVDEYIGTHLADPELSLDQIAKVLAGSPSHISRTYKKVKGVGVTRAINQQRVETAQRELLDTEKGITDVALDIGFTNLHHFGRVFREITGITPTQFRRAKIG